MGHRIYHILFLIAIKILFFDETYSVSLKDALETHGFSLIVRDGQFPFVVTVLIANTTIHTGVIIAPMWIFTAAHFFDEFSGDGTRLEIIAGSITNKSLRQHRKVWKLFIHPDYDSVTLASDVALLKIPSLDINNYTKIIKLSERWIPSVYSECQSIGLTPTSNWSLSLSLERSNLSWSEMDTIVQCAVTGASEVIHHLCVFEPTSDSLSRGYYGDHMVCDGLHSGIITLRHPKSMASDAVYSSTGYFRKWVEEKVLPDYKRIRSDVSKKRPVTLIILLFLNVCPFLYSRIF